MIIKGNLLDVKVGIICHQVNCVGVFSAGLAATIAKKWPKVKALYHMKKDWNLGDVQCINVSDSSAYPLYVANCASQKRVGWNEIQTDYPAVKHCFEGVFWLRKKTGKNLPICIPYRYGCGLGGGDWDIVLPIIESVIPDVIVIALPEEEKAGTFQCRTK